jgi:TonB family protein
LEQQMSNELTMGLLPHRRVNYRSLSAGFALESLLMAVLIQLWAVQPKVGVPAKHMVITPLILQQPVLAEQPPIRAYIPPNKLRLPPDLTFQMPNSARLPEPPSIASLATLPVFATPRAAPPPAVETGSFLAVTAKPTLEKPIEASKVQTGGFGDPNGVATRPTNGHAITINAFGTWDLPSGPRDSDGLGRANGVPAVVPSAGFGNGVVSPNGGGGKGVILQAGFDSKSVAEAPTKTIGQDPLTTPIEILAKPRPDYSEEGRQLRVEGEVQLEVVFAATGQAHAVKVIRGLGHGLDEQAVRAAEQIKFRPAKHEGRPVDSTAVVHIIFELAS